MTELTLVDILKVISEKLPTTGDEYTEQRVSIGMLVAERNASEQKAGYWLRQALSYHSGSQDTGLCTDDAEDALLNMIREISQALMYQRLIHKTFTKP